MAKKWQRLILLFDIKRFFLLLQISKLNVGLERYFQMKENRIAIGEGRPEIHRFEVRCFEQKLDKLSRYLEVRC